MKIILTVGYDVVGGSIDDLHYQMQEALEKGWEPYGNLVIHTSRPMGGQPILKFFQSIVYNEVVEEDDVEQDVPDTNNKDKEEDTGRIRKKVSRRSVPRG